jgi:transcription antitermination protein NusB
VDPGPEAGRPPRDVVGHRRRRAARRIAIDVIYQADVTGRRPSEIVGEWEAAGKSVHPYAAELARGVEAELAEIDALLGANAEEWTVPRMAVVDRTILRVACYELRAGLPPAIAINEAIEAANELSTQDSGRFINGVLGRIARTWDQGDPGVPAEG